MKHPNTSLWRKGGTTIVCNADGMAADSRVSVEGAPLHRTNVRFREKCDVDGLGNQ